MAWQDRHYYQDRGGTAGNPLMWFLSGSVPLGTWFGIRVRMHASMIILIVLTLLFAETRGGIGAKNAMTSMTILFFSVLLHEFGHCFGARWVGGDAHEILMWPLGGLAMTDPPHRPWPSFITTAAGPLVNLVICIITGSAIAILNNSAGAIPWFPVRDGLKSYVPHDWTTYYLWWIFLVNYALLLFNLMLVFYPFDGGRMIQELLWVKFGYYKSMRFASVTGMFGAAIVAMFGLVTWSFFLVLIAVFGFMACYRQRQALRETGPEGWQDAVDYSSSLYGERRSKKTGQRSLLKLRRMEEKAAAEQVRIDAILAKVSAHGMLSLTWGEKRALRKATEHQRRRDLEFSPGRRRI